MGKRNYAYSDVSSRKTEALAIEDLLVLDGEGDDDHFSAVHRRYFEKEKIACPACGSTKTRCSKLVKRKFKDIIESGEAFRIVDLHFYQRYFRCDNCGVSVFPEPISFGEKSVHYTNRLADKLARGTFRYSYKKVCEKYGVPASTASVGAIMRRQIQQSESKLYPIKTPDMICTVEVPFYGEVYPVILASYADNTYCVDILRDNSEGAYSHFFKTLDIAKVNVVCIEPNDSLQAAVASCIPKASMVLADECIARLAREAMVEVIRIEGKRLSLKHKKDRLTLHAKHLPDDFTKKQILNVLEGRPLLKSAYTSYQQLFDLLEDDWNYEMLSEWACSLSPELDAFDELRDVIEVYETEINRFLSLERQLPEFYPSDVKAVFDAIGGMPHCIFDVLRARSLLTTEPHNIRENGKILRLGIPVSHMKQKLNEISDNIKEEREYGLEREN